MKVLVTGVAGFIGSFVAERLLGLGHEVVGLDNFDPFYDPRRKRQNLQEALTEERFQLVEGDFRDEGLLSRLFAPPAPEAVIHLGARAGVRPSLQEPALYADVNVTGTVRLLEAFRRSRVEGEKRFVFASSSSVYGRRPLRPFSEADNVDTPVSPYAATKKAGELLSYTYHHLCGIHVACLRFFTVYGPRQRPEMAIHRFTAAVERGAPVRIFGDGSARRDFTYIDDIVGGVCAALDRCHGYRIYNLGRGQDVALRDVLRLIEGALGKKALVEYLPEAPGDVPATYANIARARRELGYAPAVPIAEGIPRFVEWFKQSIKGTTTHNAS